MSRAPLYSIKEPEDVLQSRLVNARTQLRRGQSRLDSITGDSHFDDRRRSIESADIANWKKQIELLEGMLS